MKPIIKNVKNQPYGKSATVVMNCYEYEVEADEILVRPFACKHFQDDIEYLCDDDYEAYFIFMAEQMEITRVEKMTPAQYDEWILVCDNNEIDK